MKKTAVILIALILCICCSVSAAERKTPEKDYYYIGAMRVVRCREYVSLRETPDKTGKVLEKVPLDAIVLNCTNNVKKYAHGKYKGQYDYFIRCEYNGQEGYILKKFLVRAPEAEPGETKQNSDLMTREEITGGTEENRRIVLDWKEYNVSVLASYEVAPENNANWEYLRVGCFIDNEPIWGYTEAARQTGQLPNLKAFIGGTEDEPQVYIYDAEYGLIMLDLMDGTEVWTLAKGSILLGKAAAEASDRNTGILYIAGTESPGPVAISSGGEILWRSETGSKGLQGITEISLYPDGIIVSCENGKAVTLDYNGKVSKVSDGV